MIRRYLGLVAVAEAMGVSRHAVHKWRARYPAGSSHPFPAPDVEVDGAPGWSPDRLEELMEWRNGLPGRGAGGGRPHAVGVRAEFFAEAARRDFTPEETERMLVAFNEEFPEMTQEQLCGWLLEKWRE